MWPRPPAPMTTTFVPAPSTGIAFLTAWIAVRPGVGQRGDVRRLERGSASPTERALVSRKSAKPPSRLMPGNDRSRSACRRRDGRRGTAAGDERMDDDGVADLDVGDAGPDLVDPAGVLVARRVGQLDLGLLGPLALLDVQVGAAQARPRLCARRRRAGRCLRLVDLVQLGARGRRADGRPSCPPPPPWSARRAFALILRSTPGPRCARVGSRPCWRRSRAARARWSSWTCRRPASPGPGEVVLRPEVVGVCGSDVHLFHGDLGDDVFPRIQGHEISAVVDAVGPGVDARARRRSRRGVARAGLRALLPVQHRPRERVRQHRDHRRPRRRRAAGAPGACRRSQVFAVGDMAPAVTAFVEPTSIGVRTVVRARVSAEDRVVVLGAGPIGQAVCLAARDRGAAVLMADVVPERLEHARAMGADARRLRRRRRGGRPGARLGGRRRRGGADRDDRRARGGPQRVRRHRAGRAARARRALAPRGQPAAHGLPDQGARRPRRELLQRRRVRRRGRPRAPQRGCRRAAHHRRVRLRAGARGAALRRRTARPS